MLPFARDPRMYLLDFSRYFFFYRDTRREWEGGGQSGRIRGRRLRTRGSPDPRGSQRRRCFFETGISRAIPSNLRSLRSRNAIPCTFVEVIT